MIMKFLIDENISWRIVSKLKTLNSFEFLHLSKTQLNKPPKDHEIWKYARENQFSIITNDEDFIDLVTINGFPPKVLVLKTGNQSTQYLVDLLILKQDLIIEFWHQPDYGVLELF